MRAQAYGIALDSVRFATTAATGTYLTDELEAQELNGVTGAETQLSSTWAAGKTRR